MSRILRRAATLGFARFHSRAAVRNDKNWPDARSLRRRGTCCRFSNSLELCFSWVYRPSPSLDLQVCYKQVIVKRSNFQRYKLYSGARNLPHIYPIFSVWILIIFHFSFNRLPLLVNHLLNFGDRGIVRGSCNIRLKSRFRSIKQGIVIIGYLLATLQINATLKDTLFLGQVWIS